LRLCEKPVSRKDAEKGKTKAAKNWRAGNIYNFLESIVTTLYLANWVIPISSPPIADGAVAVDGDRIVGVGARDAMLAQFPSASTRDFGEAAVLPGLVNCHTHLELTAMRGYLEREENDFFAWLKKLTIARLERMTADDLYVSAACGAVEAARAGITCVADASDSAQTSMRALRDVGLRGTVYQESFGPDARLAQENLEKLKEKVQHCRELANERVRVGVSPHAPYTVCGAQLELIAEYALREKLPVMMHAAESEAEFQFMLEGTGPFAEGLSRRGIEWVAQKVSPIKYLASHGILDTTPLLAHCIRVDEEDINLLKQADARVAHCPKSNAKLGHGRAPLAAFINRGLKFGLGSDSVASNNNCDLIEEARFAVLSSRAAGEVVEDNRMIDAGDVLRAATLGGAEALGLESQVGSLEIGKQADVAVVALGGSHQQPVYDPVDAIVFASSGRDVRCTMVAGREVFNGADVVTTDEARLRHRLKEISIRF
jgi:5-methylthioadenosine/S-adenosylhomocysteine deaminase